jgi:hypothetical protein
MQLQSAVPVQLELKRARAADPEARHFAVGAPAPAAAVDTDYFEALRDRLRRRDAP